MQKVGRGIKALIWSLHGRLHPMERAELTHALTNTAPFAVCRAPALVPCEMLRVRRDSARCIRAASTAIFTVSMGIPYMGNVTPLTLRNLGESVSACTRGAVVSLAWRSGRCRGAWYIKCR